MWITIDLEAVRDPEMETPEDKNKAEEDPKANDRVPSPAALQVVSYAAIKSGKAWENLSLVSDCGPNEAPIVDSSLLLLKETDRAITWGGRGFDFPLLVARALRHGLSWNRLFHGRGWNYRYDTEAHWDVMDDAALFGAGRFMGLDLAARLVGFPGKVGVSGDKVQELWDAGALDVIDSYCCCDVAQTTAVAMRMALLKGWDFGVYHSRAAGLLELVDTDDRLKPLRDRIDRDRFLLTTKEAA